MLNGALEEILQRFPLLRSTDPEEGTDVMVRQFGASRGYAVSSPIFAIRANFLKLQSIKLGFMSMSTPCGAEYPEHSDYRQRFILSGNAATTLCGRAVDCRPNETIVISPGQTAKHDFSENFSQQVLILDPAAVERKLAALLGGKPNRKLEILSQSRYASDQSPRLRGLMEFLSKQLDDASPTMPAILLQELEETIILAFLSVNEHNFSQHLREDAEAAAPRAVRRAEEYMETNWERSVSIEELAEVANVSARSLYRSFRKTRSFSPLMFARIVRLRKANSLLLTAAPDISVTGVAFRCGFSNPGHFARYYRNVFGESPSETLSRARARKLTN